MVRPGSLRPALARRERVRYPFTKLIQGRRSAWMPNSDMHSGAGHLIWGMTRLRETDKAAVHG